ncbi:MAG: hypothetical protein UT30_C0021G0015 [Candidatus Uhrbacteria bacterium GW2011_GWF2_39_13]|uniref:DUF1559 domain-containing protein n=1 Tax=Candidatus Uhrbacteria bacterium GW2011_GWF2_39_13 TaxID=1618995 RepID=A0A0G0MTH6_9BACT|nr:MAG: hypothetical protein UT30_C0021G0015 [Candidatus Uhrbacteria bacterium GW2011_GWF2_39_13]
MKTESVDSKPNDLEKESKFFPRNLLESTELLRCLFALIRQKVEWSFTLVELLIVIAIMIILMALLMPALSKAREMGRDAVCKNKLKQIGLAIHMYDIDYDGWMLPAYQATASRKYQTSWVYVLMPYLQGKIVGNYYQMGRFYQCPSDRNPVSITNISTGNMTHYHTYGYNETFGDNLMFNKDPFTGDYAYAFKKVSYIAMKNPNTFMLVETSINPYDGGPISQFTAYSKYTGLNYVVKFYHNKHTNVLFFDSSVRNIVRGDNPFWSGIRSCVE